MIKPIPYNQLPKLKSDYMAFSPNETYFGWYENEQLVAVAAYKKIGKKYRLASNYTFPEHRKKGYMTKLLTEITRIIPQPCVIDARCLETSWRIYQGMGFKITKKISYKKFEIYIMEMEKK